MLNKSAWEQYIWLFPVTVFIFIWSLFNTDDYRLVVIASVLMLSWALIIIFRFDYKDIKPEVVVRKIVIVLGCGLLSFLLTVLCAFVFGDGKLPFVAPSFDLLVAYFSLSIVLTVMVRMLRSLGYNALDASDLLGGMIYGIAIAYFIFQREL